MQRAIDRRPPQNIQSLHEPFDHKSFSFTRVRRDEILFELSTSCRQPGECLNSSDNESSAAAKASDDSERHLVMINVSPLEYGHVLLVPQLNHCRPQVHTDTHTHQRTISDRQTDDLSK